MTTLDNHGECVVALNTAGERIEQLESALQQIVQWSEAYPVTVFPEPTPEQWVKMAELLKDAGMTLDSFSASNMRHAVEGVGKIAIEALETNSGCAGGRRGEAMTPPIDVLLSNLMDLNACAPGCEGRCRFCPDEVGRQAAAEIERLTALLRDAPIIIIDKGNAHRRGETEMLAYAAKVAEWAPKVKAALAYQQQVDGKS